MNDLTQRRGGAKFSQPVDSALSSLRLGARTMHLHIQDRRLSHIRSRACAGGNGIFPAVNAVISNEWMEIKGKIGPKQWWPGTKYISVAILPRSTGAAAVLLVDDVSLRLIMDSKE